MLQALSFSGNAKNDVAKYCSAALLNAAKGNLTPVLSPTVVINIWKEFASTGYGTFSPFAGATWSANEIIDYLLSTM